VRRPSVVGGREGGGCGRAACGVRVWRTGGIERNGGVQLGLASECWAGSKMNVGLKYFVD
jgi:hypothetical protein